ncbi:hypothetical protein QU38_01830, partial [Staphylococcus aureus]
MDRSSAATTGSACLIRARAFRAPIACSASSRPTNGRNSAPPAAKRRGSFRHVEPVHHEAEIFGLLAIALEPARLAAMAGLHVDAEDERVGVGLLRAQPGDPFGRLVILHLAVPQAGGDIHRRIGPRRDIVVGRVAQHIVVI